MAHTRKTAHEARTVGTSRPVEKTRPAEVRPAGGSRLFRRHRWPVRLGAAVVVCVVLGWGLVTYVDRVGCRDRFLVDIQTDVHRAIVSHAGLRVGNRRVSPSRTPCGSGSNANPRLIQHGRPATTSRKVILPKPTGHITDMALCAGPSPLTP